MLLEQLQLGAEALAWQTQYPVLDAPFESRYPVPVALLALGPPQMMQSAIVQGLEAVGAVAGQEGSAVAGIA